MKWAIAVGVAGAFVTAAVTMTGICRPTPAQATPSVNPGVRATLCQDGDQDGYGIDCPKGPDCNDRDPRISPEQKETCNLRDDDCNGLVDDGLNCGAVAYSAPGEAWLEGRAVAA